MRVLSSGVLAAVVLLAGCATMPSGREALERHGFPSDGAYFVTLNSKGAAAALFSGSVFDGDKKFKAAGGRELYRSSAADAANVVLKAPRSVFSVDISAWNAAMPAARAWIEDYALSLDAMRTKVFGYAAPSIKLTLKIAPIGSDIDHIAGAAVNDDALGLEFVAPDNLFSQFQLAMTSSTFAHEIHHAYWAYYDWKASGARRSPDGPKHVMALREAAAELFGICVGLGATNVQDRVSERTYAADGMGGVLTDQELYWLMSGEGNYTQTRGEPVSEAALFEFFGPVIANTIWTSVIGAEYIAEDDRESGRKLRELCTVENLGSLEGFRALVRRFAEDGVDAPHLPDLTPELKKAGSKQLRDAIDRWRVRNGLAKRYEIEGVIGEDRLKVQTPPGPS